MQVEVFANQGYYTAKHNALYDVVLPNVGGNAWKLLDVILRQTKGWNRETVSLSLRDLMRLAGIKAENTVISGLKELREFKQGEKPLPLIIELRSENRWEPTRYALNFRVKLEWQPVAEGGGEPTLKNNVPASNFKVAPTSKNNVEPASNSEAPSTSKNEAHIRKEKTSEFTEEILEEKGPGNSPNELLPALIERYRNLLNSAKDASELQWQAERLSKAGITLEEVQSFLDWRQSTPGIPWIYEKVTLWREDQRRQREKRRATAMVGAGQPDSLALFPPDTTEERLPRKGAYGRVLDLLAESFPTAVLVTWFEPLTELKVEDGVLFLTAPDGMFRQYIENNYAVEFHQAIENAHLNGVVFQTGIGSPAQKAV